MDATSIAPARKRLLIPDPIALKSLEEGADIQIVASNQEIRGFEVYIVEQWACTRSKPTIAIVTFTGQMQHKIQVTVVELLASSQEYSLQMKTYLQNLGQHHTRQHETPLGELLVTNLSTFPSTLTILAVPDGNISKYRTRFIVNENLKRLACSGRAGMSLTSPNEATVSRFRALFKVSDRIEVNDAVIELVQMCQIALSMFTKLPMDFCDGLLCDFTQKRQAEWWSDIGVQYYNAEPSDGILGPTTIAAILGLFLGARNRLHAYGAPVPKDAFDIKALKRGVAYFQKSQRLVKTRRLDHLTLQRLHRVTAKVAHHEGWNVPRAVKSTVAELGKGGEMMMGIVGVREKASPAEIETADFDLFLKQIQGDQCKWLWHGKRRKTVYSRNLAATADASQPFSIKTLARTNWSSDSDGNKVLINDHKQPQDSPSFPDTKKNTATLIKEREEKFEEKAYPDTNRRNGDNKRGLERIRDVMNTGLQMSVPKTIIGVVNKSDMIVGDDVDAKWQARPMHTSSKQKSSPHAGSESTSEQAHSGKHICSQQTDIVCIQNSAIPKSVVRVRVQSLESPIPRQELGPVELRSRRYTSVPNFMTRPTLHNEMKATTTSARSAFLGRNLGANRKISREADLDNLQIKDAQEPAALILENEVRCIEMLYEQLQSVTEIKEIFVSHLALLQSNAGRRGKEIDKTTQHFDETRQETQEALKERLREVEALGARLEYELGVLASKIEDVEEGVKDLDRQVSDLESRSRSLDVDSRYHTWQHWTETLVRRIGIV